MDQLSILTYTKETYLILGLRITQFNIFNFNIFFLHSINIEERICIVFLSLNVNGDRRTVPPPP